MASSTTPPRWRFLVSPRWLAWHAFAVVAAWGMLWLGDWQYHRALGGNALSWAYTFEWPVFVIFGVVFWGKTIADEWRQQTATAAGETVPVRTAADGADIGRELPAGAHTPATHDDEAAADPELAAYNQWLATLNARPARP